MALCKVKTLIPLLSRAYSTSVLTRALVPRVSGRGSWRQLHLSSTVAQKPVASSSIANGELLKAVERELLFVKKDLHQLPEVSTFACSTEGAVATFTHTVGTEEVKVTLDTNSGMELDLMDMEEEEVLLEGDHNTEESNMKSEEDEVEKVPAFTVSVSKPSGNMMQFECSFHPGVNDFEEMSIMIDSVSMVPKECRNEESIYTVSTDQLGKDLYDGLERYLQDRGINRNFGSDLLNFYSMFEHHAYATNFLEKMKGYCSEQ